jgi:hypothetical protein
MPMAPMGDLDSFLTDRNFALACTEYIQQQSVLFPWLGVLDQETLGLAFQAGVEWYARNQNRPACNAVRRS